MSAVRAASAPGQPVGASAPAAPALARRTDVLRAWDANAPLSDAQKESVFELAAQADERPLPQWVGEWSSAAAVLPHAPFPLSVDATNAAPAAAATSADVANATVQRSTRADDAPGLPTATRVETAQQFFAWFSDIEAQMEGEQERSYRSYASLLEQYRQHADDILAEIDGGLGRLDALLRDHEAVSTRTGALHGACESLLAEQTRLVAVGEGIAQRLSYFNELEKASARLASASTVAVAGDAIVPLIARLDECVAYVSSNRQFKEADVFLAKFSQCLGRALTLVKMGVVQTLKSGTQSCLEQMAAHQKNAVASGAPATEVLFALLYGKFRAHAPRVKAVIGELEARGGRSAEYQSLLHDCYACYFDQRRTLLERPIAEALAHLAAANEGNIALLLRSGCAYMQRVCESEYQLYQHFFAVVSPGLDNLLESLALNLYDTLRPTIIHIASMETLAELIDVLKGEVLDDKATKGPEHRAFDAVAQQLLEDLQARLVYRTEAHIEADIRRFKPSADDLAYPEKLLPPAVTAAGDKDALAVMRPETQSANGGEASDGVLLYETWYPTLQRTLMTLSRLHRCVDRHVFEVLSHDLVSTCMATLVDASTQISARKGSIDGQLFLIKHLLILREHIAPFGGNFAIREKSLDFNRLKDAAFGLLGKGSKLLALNSSNALIEFLLEAPQVTENYTDAKKDVDVQLKSVCERFIADVSKSMISPLASFLAKASAFARVRAASKGDAAAPAIKQQPFAQPDKVKQVVNETHMLLRAQSTATFRSLALYLGNRDTENVLFRPIASSIVDSFQQLLSLLESEYGPEDRQIIGCPSIEQIRLILAPPTS